MRHPRFVLFLAALASISMGSSTAKADQPMVLGGTGVIGGPGGHQFVRICPGDSFLAGAIMRIGDLLDYYEPVCAHVEADGSTGPHFEPFSGWRGAGGRGGKWTREDCAPGFVVDSIYVGTVGRGCGGGNWGYEEEPGIVAHCVEHVCRRVMPPFIRLAPGYPAPQQNPAHLNCPPGQWAVGAYGRAGTLIDSIGLVCGPAFGPFATAHLPPPKPPAAVPQADIDPAVMQQGGSGLFEEKVNPNAFGN